MKSSRKPPGRAPLSLLMLVPKHQWHPGLEGSASWAHVCIHRCEHLLASCCFLHCARHGGQPYLGEPEAAEGDRPLVTHLHTDEEVSPLRGFWALIGLSLILSGKILLKNKQDQQCLEFLVYHDRCGVPVALLFINPRVLCERNIRTYNVVKAACVAMCVCTWK